MKRVRGELAVARFLGVENKFYDTALSLTNIPAPSDCSGGEMDPSTTSMISTPPQGDTRSSRDGNRIVIKSVLVRGIVEIANIENSLVPKAPCLVYAALVLDTQSNGVQMNSEDCFTNPSASPLLAPEALRNMSFSTRFTILREEWFDLTPSAVSVAVTTVPDPDILVYNWAGIQRHFEWLLPLELPVNFLSTGATIAHVVDNSLHVIAFCSNTGYLPALAYNARIRFMG